MGIVHYRDHDYTTAPCGFKFNSSHFGLDWSSVPSNVTCEACHPYLPKRGKGLHRFPHVKRKENKGIKLYTKSHIGWKSS